MDFVFPAQAHFTCLQCGDCCRGWEIALSEAEVERIEALGWDGVDAGPMGEPILRVTDSGRAWSVLARKPDGSCVFLTDENLCALHKHFGEDSKPLMCRLYPFSFHEVSSRVAVDVAFSCRAVAADHGAPLATQQPEWTRLVEEGGVSLLSTDLAKGVRLHGELLWEIEHQIIRLLEDDTRTLVRRLWSIQQFGRLALVGDPSTKAASQLRRAIASSVPSQLDAREPPGELDRTERAVVYQWFYLLMNPVPIGFLKLNPRARRELLKKRDRQSELAIQQDDAFVDGESLGVSADDVRNVAVGVLQHATTEAALSRYLGAQILGQRFVQAGSETLDLREAIPRWLLIYPSILFVSRALAVSRGVAEVEAEDVRRAVRLIDRGAGRVSLSKLHGPRRKAWTFVLQETDAAIAAAVELERSHAQ